MKNLIIYLVCICISFYLYLLKIDNFSFKSKNIDSVNYNIKIPSINLNVNFTEYSSLDEGLEIHNISKIKNNPLVIMGHSGFGKNVFFNDLEYLNINDLIYINHNKNTYLFEINDIKYYKKFSYVNVPKENEYLYLITCDKKDMQKQLIISAKLSKISEK